jgi:hypothetical protein
MNGNLWYELAKQSAADRQRAARQAGVAREVRAATRARRARDRAQEAPAAPAIPDYAHEMFAELTDAVATPRQEAGRGRWTRTSR